MRSEQVTVKGFKVSLLDVLQHANADRLIDHYLLEPLVLILPLLQPLRFFRLHATILIPPTRIGSLADLQRLKHSSHVFAAVQLASASRSFFTIRSGVSRRRRFVIKKSPCRKWPENFITNGVDFQRQTTLILDPTLGCSLDDFFFLPRTLPPERQVHSVRRSTLPISTHSLGC